MTKRDSILFLHRCLDFQLHLGNNFFFAFKEQGFYRYNKAIVTHLNNNHIFCKKRKEKKLDESGRDEVVCSNNVLSKIIFFFRITFFRIFLIFFVLSNKRSFERTTDEFRKNVIRSNDLSRSGTMFLHLCKDQRRFHNWCD